MNRLSQFDHAYVWHPFTQMRDWLKHEPIVIQSGRGSVLRDVNGKEYLDANSSIWTNLHGHNHPRINAAVKEQLGRIAHSSALGLANEPASLLARELVGLANPFLGKESTSRPSTKSKGSVANKLGKVFFSDDGSTALEVALKMSYECARRDRLIAKPRFLSIDGAYHGDTVGAVSLGHIDLFHKTYAGLLFKSDKVMAPYCYRCPFNRAQPERADARTTRKCRWECVDKVERRLTRQAKKGFPYAAFVYEPLMQGAAGMIPQPLGWLSRVAELVRGHGAYLVADEVMTGLGRCGIIRPEDSAQPGTRKVSKSRMPPKGMTSLFASHQEGVQPDFLCLAKGLTGGYLPMAATLTTPEVFAAFLGEYREFKTFFHGHSYTANQLGAAAALASLRLLQGDSSIRSRMKLEQTLAQELETLWELKEVGDIRRVGLVAGIELVRDWRTREPFPLASRAGIRVCEHMARQGVLTRPIGNVIVLMPPYCTSPDQVHRMVSSVRRAIRDVLVDAAHSPG